MTSVIELLGNPFAKNPNKDFKAMGIEYFDSIGRKAKNNLLGEVMLDESGI